MLQKKRLLKLITYAAYIVISFALLVFILYSSKNYSMEFMLPAIGIWLAFLFFCIYKIGRARGASGIFEKGTISVRDLDGMDGAEFEKLTCDILAANDFEIAENTQISGDFGVDVLAQKDGVTYAIQCKRYSAPVGVEAVQQVYAGRAYYECHVALVLSNQYYTAQAQKLADKIGVVLWDRDMLRELL